MEAEGGGRRSGNWLEASGQGSKEGAAAGGGTERLRKDRFVPYVPVRRGTTCNFKIRTDAAAIDVAAAQYTGILFY